MLIFRIDAVVVVVLLLLVVVGGRYEFEETMFFVMLGARGRFAGFEDKQETAPTPTAFSCHVLG